MYYFVYKTINLINNKIYIGCHSTENLNDGYLGSGKFLKRAVKKYGKENFKREILKFFDNEKDMYNYEREIVNEDFIKAKTNYNSALGGGRGNLGYEVYHQKERLEKLSKASKNKVMAIDKTTNKKVKIDIEEFRNNPDRYVGSTKGMIVAKTKDGEIISITEEEFKNNQDKYVGSTKGMISVRDKDGNTFSVPYNDERYLSGELVGITKGCKQTPESNIKRSMTQKGKILTPNAYKKVTCEICGKTMTIGNFIRWHENGKCIKK